MLRLKQNEKEANANEIAMLLANMAKADDMLRILKLKRAVPKPLSTSEYAMDQLMDCFVKGAEGSFNKQADFDYLSYFFADLSKVKLVLASHFSLLTHIAFQVSGMSRLLHQATRARQRHHTSDKVDRLHRA